MVVRRVVVDLNYLCFEVCCIGKFIMVIFDVVGDCYVCLFVVNFDWFFLIFEVIFLEMEYVVDFGYVDFGGLS